MEHLIKLRSGIEILSNEELINVIKAFESRNESKCVQNESELQSQFTPTKIDELPFVMISEITSFLPFNDLKSFEICNRSIFIGTRSPISLNKLPLQYSRQLITYLKNNNNKMQYFHWHRFK
eukprot:443730_1